MYKLSRLAVEDFASIYEYTLLNFGVLQADTYTDNLESALCLLSSSPLMGYECPLSGYLSPAGTGASWTMCPANILNERCAKVPFEGLTEANPRGPAPLP